MKYFILIFILVLLTGNIFCEEEINNKYFIYVNEYANSQKTQKVNQDIGSFFIDDVFYIYVNFITNENEYFLENFKQYSKKELRRRKLLSVLYIFDRIVRITSFDAQLYKFNTKEGLAIDYNF